MKKIWISIFVIIILCSFAVSSAEENISFDLVKYVNQGILNIGEIETTALENYASVTGENYTSDENVYNALKNEVIPLYKRFYEELRQITPETDAVRKIHQLYVRGADLINEGFRVKMLGLENNDESIVLMANRKIEKGSEDVKEWKKQLLELCKKYGVAPEESKEKK